ncbi:MAG: hypothetical protein ACR2JO_05470, partial [Mycobacteriales bacterium]
MAPTSTRPAQTSTTWGRGKLQAALAAAAAAAVLLVAGLVLAVVYAVTPETATARPAASAADTETGTRPGRAGTAEDALAAAPLPTV